MLHTLRVGMKGHGINCLDRLLAYRLDRCWQGMKDIGKGSVSRLIHGFQGTYTYTSWSLFQCLGLGVIIEERMFCR